MVEALKDIDVADDDPVSTDQILLALTAGSFVYDDGATQVFGPDGATTYVEGDRQSCGRWYVDDDGRFCSYWPPSYRACYSLRWIVEGANIVGLRFSELHGRSHLDGRYR